MIITIDGPAASGKSTTALMLAKKVHGFYVYTGALFRAAAYLLSHYGHHAKDTIASVSAQECDQYLDRERLSYHYTDDQGAQLFFDGVAITEQLYTQEISQLASVIATNRCIRTAIQQLEQSIVTNATAAIIIVDGRDSGSVVFPQAEHKFYLTATMQERVRRMENAYKNQGMNVSADDILRALSERDERDSKRPNHPLTIPKDAIVIDTTHKTREEVIALIMSHI